MQKGYAGAWGPESQGAIINAVEHSLSVQSLVSAKEEGGTCNFSPTNFQQRTLRIENASTER